MFDKRKKKEVYKSIFLGVFGRTSLYRHNLYYSRIFMTATKRSFMKKKKNDENFYQNSFFVYPAVILSSCYRNRFELTISILCLTFFFSSRNCNDCYCLCRCKNFTFASHSIRFNPIFIHTSMYVSI